MKEIDIDIIKEAYDLVDGLTEKAEREGLRYFFVGTVGSTNGGYETIYSCLCDDDLDIEVYSTHGEEIKMDEFKAHLERVKEILAGKCEKWFINAFFEVDRVEDEKSISELRKAGNLFNTRAEAINALKNIRLCIK